MTKIFFFVLLFGLALLTACQPQQQPTVAPATAVPTPVPYKPIFSTFSPERSAKCSVEMIDYHTFAVNFSFDTNRNNYEDGDAVLIYWGMIIVGARERNLEERDFTFEEHNRNRYVIQDKDLNNVSRGGYPDYFYISRYKYHEYLYDLHPCDDYRNSVSLLSNHICTGYGRQCELYRD